MPLGHGMGKGTTREGDMIAYSNMTLIYWSSGRVEKLLINGTLAGLDLVTLNARLVEGEHPAMVFLNRTDWTR